MPRNATAAAVLDALGVPVDETIDEVDAATIIGGMRLSRDLKEAAALLTPQQQRILVDLYYQIQEQRKRNANQLRAAHAEPNAWLDLMSDYMIRLEKLIAGALDTATNTQPVSRWCKSIFGMGPVLTAGLAAYVDITRTPSVGGLWRLAGLDPTRTWDGRAGIDDLITQARRAEPDDWHAFIWLCQHLNVRPGSVLYLAGLVEHTLSLADAQTLYAAQDGDPEAIAMVEEQGDNVLLRGSLDSDAMTVAFATAYSVDLEKNDDAWDSIKTVLAKRPWNAKLKTLCWKIGDSFMKFHRNDKCFYGHVYAKRKIQEVEYNDLGRFSTQAIDSLRQRQIKSAEVRAWYNGSYPGGTTAGVLGVIGRTGAETQQLRLEYLKSVALRPGEGVPMLPLGRLDLRARRKAVKLFLSHYWSVAFYEHFGKLPRKPYILAKQPELHTQFIPPPGYEDVFRY